MRRCELIFKDLGNKPGRRNPSKYTKLRSKKICNCIDFVSIHHHSESPRVAHPQGNHKQWAASTPSRYSHPQPSLSSRTWWRSTRVPGRVLHGQTCGQTHSRSALCCCCCSLTQPCMVRMRSRYQRYRFFFHFSYNAMSGLSHWAHLCGEDCMLSCCENLFYSGMSGQPLC